MFCVSVILMLRKSYWVVPARNSPGLLACGPRPRCLPPSDPQQVARLEERAGMLIDCLPDAVGITTVT